MNDLIKIENTVIGDACVPTVNARELHEFLEVKTKFATWINNRIKEYEFLENKDYTTFSKNLEKLGRPSLEYHISIPMAKELAMVERNDKGKEARRYFIECEEQLKRVLTPKFNYQLGIINASTEVERMVALNNYEIGYVQPLEQFKEEALPKVNYYDLVLSCSNTVPILNIAQDYGWTSQQMNTKLNELGVQYKQGKIWVLTAKYLTQGCARLETKVLNPGTPKQAVVQSLRWTQKGRLMIYEMLKSEGILPMCELSYEPLLAPIGAS